MHERTPLHNASVTAQHAGGILASGWCAALAVGVVACCKGRVPGSEQPALSTVKACVSAGDGRDLSGHGLSATPVNGEWVAGLYKQAFRFDGDDHLLVKYSTRLDLTRVTMMAWIRPVKYDTAQDRGIIMNVSSIDRWNSYADY